MMLSYLFDRQKEPAKRLSAGFTIIEVIFGIFVFTVGILAVASMQTRSIAANANARNISEATVGGASAVADIRPMGYNTPDLTDTGAVVGEELVESPHAYPVGDRYQTTYGVRQLDVLNNEAAVITVQVSWEDHGRQRSETFHYFKIDEFAQ